jgi:Leu/Phe-tRNA-protein transferase
MKILSQLVFCVGIMLFAAPGYAADDEQLLALVTQLKARQTELLDNQVKTDAKVTELAAAVHEARIFMSRAGGLHKPPKK